MDSTRSTMAIYVCKDHDGRILRGKEYQTGDCSIIVAIANRDAMLVAIQMKHTRSEVTHQWR